MPIDPTQIPAARRNDVITEATACRSCGYDLQGLLAGGNCPECGAVIAAKRRSAKGDNLTDAPAAYLKRYAALSLLNAWIAPAAIILTLGGYVFSNASFGVLAFLGGVAMVAVVWLLTRPRPMSSNTVSDVVLDDVRWRNAVRFGMTLWPIVALLIVFHAVALVNNWGARGVFGWLRSLTMLAAFGGTVPLLIHLGSVASWAGDTGLASRLRGAAWTLSIGTPVILIVSGLAMVVPQSIDGMVNLLRIALLVLFVFGLLVGVIGVAQSGANAVAAVRTNAAQHARDQRIAERRAREMSSTVDRQQFSAPEPVDMRERTGTIGTDTDPAPRIGQGPRIERATDIESYELEPDDQPAPPHGHIR